LPRSFDLSSPGYLKALTILAALFLLLPLPVMQYVGEESIFALKSYEMHLRGDIWHTYLFGGMYVHTPLYHWPIILFCNVFGWEHMDIGVRLISVIASWLSALTAALLARHLFPEYNHAGWLAALVYLSMGEVMFWYGWLGYVDATFACFIFSATASLWMAIEKRHLGWLALSMLLISIAFMVKNITAYALLALAGLAMAHGMRAWRFVFSPGVLALSVASLIVPWAWGHWGVHGDVSITVAVADGMRNFKGFNAFDYLFHLASFPFVFFFRALPVGFFLIWLWIKRKNRMSWPNAPLSTMILVLAAIFLPFWIAAGATPRYLVPLYGWAAMIFTCMLLKLDRQDFLTGVKVIAIVILLKIPYSFAALPYLKDWRPERDLRGVAEEILSITDGKQIRTLHDMATGISIAAYIDARIPPENYIRWYNGSERNVYVLTEQIENHLGELVKQYRRRGDHIYLYWLP